jgi:diadenosine tetraphosphate (Ap4A) HIT family hydrolase
VAISRISNALTKGALCQILFQVPAVYTHDIRDFVAVDNTALNVVCNQEYAQVVPHVRPHTVPFYLVHGLITSQVHYHIIPAPKFSTLPTSLGPRELNQNPPPTGKDMHRQEYESRDGLDEDDARALVERIKAHL